MASNLLCRSGGKRGGGKGGGDDQWKMGTDTLWADISKTSRRELDVGRGGGRGGWQWTW